MNINTTHGCYQISFCQIPTTQYVRGMHIAFQILHILRSTPTAADMDLAEETMLSVKVT